MLGTNLMIVIWLAALILFAIMEAATVGLVSIWFAAGSLVALIAAAAGAPIWLQATLFLVVSAGLVALLRPLAAKFITPKKTAMNADRHVGRVCLTTEDIDNLEGTGAVKLDGVIWTARSLEDTKIPAGSTVRIAALQGSKVLVELVKQEVNV